MERQLPEFIRIQHARICRKDLLFYRPGDNPKQLVIQFRPTPGVVTEPAFMEFSTQVDRDNALKELDNLLT